MTGVLHTAKINTAEFIMSSHSDFSLSHARVMLNISFFINSFLLLLLLLSLLFQCIDLLLHKTGKNILLCPQDGFYDAVSAISRPQRTKNLANIQPS